MRTSLQNIMEEVSKLTLKVREKGFVWMQRRALDDYKKSVFCKLLNVIYDLEREYNVFWRWRIRNWGERIDFVRCNSFFFYTGHIFMNYHFDRYYFMIIILHHNLKTHFDYSYYFNPFQCRSEVNLYSTNWYSIWYQFLRRQTLVIFSVIPMSTIREWWMHTSLQADIVETLLLRLATHASIILDFELLNCQS